MDWTEIIILTPTAYTQSVCDIATMTADGGIYIEDYSNLEEEVQQIAHIDLIEQDLLDKDRENSKIHLYINAQQNPQEAVSFLTQRFKAASIPFEIEQQAIKEEDWANTWKAYYKPMKIGRRVVVCPSWETYQAETEDVVVRLDPGMAFGTGTHESTRLCIEQGQEYVQKGDTVLDLGCGSGILSIISMLLGAKQALAVDIDPLAVKVAQENAAANGLGADVYKCVCGNIVTDTKLQQETQAGYNVIFANIVADVIIALAPILPSQLKAGGKVIASGIIDIREQEVIAALTKAGLKIIQRKEENGWVCLVCEK